MAVQAARSTRTNLALILGGVLSLGGCASVVSPTDTLGALGPVEAALTKDRHSLEVAAQGGDAQAQMALSIVLAYGLGGSPSFSEAQTWRARAVQPRGTQPITQYTAAFNGAPSRINIINIPRYDISSAQIVLIDRCTGWLSGRAVNPAACGTLEASAALKERWDRAR